VLSAMGRALLPHAERVQAALKDAEDALAAVGQGAGTPIACGRGTLAGSGLTSVLKAFAHEHLDARLSLRTATSAEVSALVRSGEVGIGLRYFDDPTSPSCPRARSRRNCVPARSPPSPSRGFPQPIRLSWSPAATVV
jgi:DNA-binding transcriptional LysR family regulator